MTYQDLTDKALEIAEICQREEAYRIAYLSHFQTDESKLDEVREELESELEEFIDILEEDMVLESVYGRKVIAPKISAEIEALREKSKVIIPALHNRKYKKLKTYIRAAANLARAAPIEEDSNEIALAPLYHGTFLGFVELSLKKDEAFGWERTSFYLDEAEATEYTNSLRLEFLQSLAAAYNIEVNMSKAAEGIILEFNPDVLPEAAYFETEDNKPEFIITQKVPLTALSNRTKNEIIKRHRLTEDSPQYKNLFE